MYPWRAIWFTLPRLFCKPDTVCACVASVQSRSALHSITSPAFDVWLRAIVNALSDNSPVAISGLCDSYSPYSDVCISSRGGFMQDDDASESKMMVRILPAMVAARNCAALSFGGTYLAPYPAPPYAVAVAFG